MPGPETLDPEVLAALEAIDATLAGQPVEPRHADLAELALLVRAERACAPHAFGARLDERVAQRFGRPAPSRPRRRRVWLWAPAAGLAASVAVAVAIVVGGSSQPTRMETLAEPAATTPAPAGTTAATAGSAAASSGPQVLQPPAGGRKIVQSGQLALTTAPERIDQVAQEVFDAAGRWGAIVRSSNVTANGPSSYAQFQLSIPGTSVSQAMATLSGLPYARVASRTDTTQDVTDSYQAAVRALNDARSLRTSLLKQLANATGQTQIDSLKAQIHDVEASISSDEATLQRLNRQINYSQVTLTISAGTTPAAGSGGGGFTVGKAAHYAGRVLTVAAGAALIAAAALVPLGLLAGLAWWGGKAIRRRRREQALDLA